MENTIPIADAKNRLPAIVRDLDKQPAVTLTRHGKPVAVLVSAAEYRRLSRTGHFADALQSFMERFGGSAVGITDAEIDEWRDRSPGRTMGF